MAVRRTEPNNWEEIDFPEVRERFLAKVKVNPETDCWEWQAYVNPSGYGEFGFASQKWTAHRVSYAMFVGTVPKELELDHLCRNRRCVNPEHLEAVPHKVNGDRGEGPTGKNSRKTHCKRGHPLFGDNVYYRRKGRECKQCAELLRQNHLARKRATLQVAEER